MTAIAIEPLEGRFIGARGTEVFWRRWRSDAPHGRVVLVHGYGEHGGRYAHLAARLADSGYEVAAPDHRGHGRSGGRPVAVESFDDYVADLHRLTEALSAQGPPLPTVMLGHSMGGLIAMAFALEHEEELAGLILSAPALLAPRMSPMALRAGRLLARLAPDVGTVSLPVRRISRTPEVVDAYHRDPYVRRRRVRARLGAEMLRVMADAAARMDRLRLPVLLLQGTDDALVDPGAARYVHEHIGSPDRTLIEYPGLYHEIFNEPERERVIDDVLGWLAAHRE